MDDVQQAVQSAKQAQRKLLSDLEKKIVEGRTRIRENRLWDLVEEAAALEELAGNLRALSYLQKNLGLD